MSVQTVLRRSALAEQLNVRGLQRGGIKETTRFWLEQTSPWYCFFFLTDTGKGQEEIGF